MYKTVITIARPEVPIKLLLDFILDQGFINITMLANCFRKNKKITFNTIDIVNPNR